MLRKLRIFTSRKWIETSTKQKRILTIWFPNMFQFFLLLDMIKYDLNNHISYKQSYKSVARLSKGRILSIIYKWNSTLVAKNRYLIKYYKIVVMLGLSKRISNGWSDTDSAYQNWLRERAKNQCSPLYVKRDHRRKREYECEMNNRVRKENPIFRSIWYKEKFISQFEEKRIWKENGHALQYGSRVFWILNRTLRGKFLSSRRLWRNS